jgi:ACS family hexuronate transporter-like MFS transporter
MVASVTGIGGCAGGLGGFLFSAVIPGFVVTHFGYTPMFVFTGTLHVLALFGMSILLRSKPSGTLTIGIAGEAVEPARS